jgi:hypothetical protein
VNNGPMKRSCARLMAEKAVSDVDPAARLMPSIREALVDSIANQVITAHFLGVRDEQISTGKFVPDHAA